MFYMCIYIKVCRIWRTFFSCLVSSFIIYSVLKSQALMCSDRHTALRWRFLSQSKGTHFRTLVLQENLHILRLPPILSASGWKANANKASKNKRKYIYFIQRAQGFTGFFLFFFLLKKQRVLFPNLWKHAITSIIMVAELSYLHLRLFLNEKT